MPSHKASSIFLLFVLLPQFLVCLQFQNLIFFIWNPSWMVIAFQKIVKILKIWLVFSLIFNYFYLFFFELFNWLCLFFKCFSAWRISKLSLLYYFALVFIKKYCWVVKRSKIILCESELCLPIIEASLHKLFFFLHEILRSQNRFRYTSARGKSCK